MNDWHCAARLHTREGEGEMGDFPPKVVLKHKHGSRVTAVAAKRYTPFQKHLKFFQRCILAVKTLVIGTVSW